MELCASLSMLIAVACWLGAASADRHAGRALEWQLLGVPFAAAALLVWTELHGNAGFDRWWPWLSSASLYPLRLLSAPSVPVRGARTAPASIAALAAGLACSLPFAQETLGAIAVPNRTYDDAPAALAGPDHVPAEFDAIVVTGTRSEHRPSDSPIDVQLIDTADIRASGADAEWHSDTPEALAFDADGDYGWYNYSGFCDKGDGLHHISPREVVYVVRGRDGLYWKLRMPDYYSDTGEAAHSSLEFAPVSAP